MYIVKLQNVYRGGTVDVSMGPHRIDDPTSGGLRWFLY